MYGVYDRNKEIREAIRAGERALDSLKEANRQLNSAGNWGLVDIFGGNTISGLMKHMKVNNASRCVDDARRDLATFRDELGDIRDVENLNIDIDGFLTFADFFFDGFVADIFVQSKIRKGQQQVREAIRRVEDIVSQLSANAVGNVDEATGEDNSEIAFVYQYDDLLLNADETKEWKLYSDSSKKIGDIDLEREGGKRSNCFPKLI